VIQKQCPFCSACCARYPEDVGLGLYPVHMTKCPRCTETAFKEVESNAQPRYQGAAEVKLKPQKVLF
jgi:hypothetical protein